MKKILVTGGAGFIGSCFVQRWIKKHNIHLVNFDALTYAGHQASIGLAAESSLYSLVQADLRSFAQVEQAINEHRPSMILHLAWSHISTDADNADILPKVSANAVAIMEIGTIPNYSLERTTRGKRDQNGHSHNAHAIAQRVQPCGVSC